MTAIALITAGRVEAVRADDQLTLPPSETITPGAAVRQTTDYGLAAYANAASADDARFFGINLSKSASNIGCTVIRKGILDGYNLSGLSYGDPVFLGDTDGQLNDAPGTVPVYLGQVIRGFGTIPSATAKKLLMLEPDAKQIKIVRWNMQANASLADQAFFIADRKYRVVGIWEIHSAAGTDGGAVNLQVSKDTGTDAPGAGTDLLTNNAGAGFNLKGTANTLQTGALSATTTDLILAPGNRLAADFAGTPTTAAGVLVTVALLPLN